MKAPRIPFSLGLLSLAVLLGSCDERKEPAAAPAGPVAGADSGEPKKTEEAVATTPDKAGTWAERLKGSKILKEGQRLTAESLEQGKAALAKIDIAPLKKQADDLMAAVRADDFAAGEKAAAALDASLNSQVLQRTIAVFKAKAEKGSDAAQALIDDYLKLPEMGPEEREFFEALKGKVAASTPEERVNFIVFATGIACEIRFGHGGFALPVVVMQGLFGTDVGVLREFYEWKGLPK